ncbi:MAG: 3-deoxy-8-phosphooctulonate synthase [Lentimicrobiaceae bacterium]|nr:3-deoxy-8-phosphooctulonate synthase [Lentimicrobiaceae bacterium]
MDVLKNIPYLNHLDRGIFFLIAGPCVVENEQMPLDIALKIKEITDKLAIPFIFKASYRKANRSSVSSFTGIGDEKALRAVANVGKTLRIPTLTDIHTAEEAAYAAQYVDILQIPAFLCRQTDLLVAAAKTGKTINIKKGQFLSPEVMKFPIEKVRSAGNQQVMLTERGTMFGYQDLVVDFRGVEIMKQNRCPVVLDITHSLQQPNQKEGVSGGQSHLIETIAKAGIAAGFDGIFMETHPDVKNAKSDSTNMLPLDKVEELLAKLVRIWQAVR